MPDTNALRQSSARASKTSHPPKALNNLVTMRSGSSRIKARALTNRPLVPAQMTSSIKSPKEKTTMGLDQKSSLGDAQTNQVMAEPSASLSHLQDRLRPADKRPLEGDCTPKAKLSFGITGMANTQALTSATNANPFVVSGEGNCESKILKKLHEDLKEGWSF